MNIPEEANWHPEPPAPASAIEALLTACGLDLPKTYLQFLLQGNGGEGELGIEPGWLQMWPVEKVMEYNNGYEIPQWLPRFFGFGSNGGGELFAFDLQSPRPGKIYMIPFGDMREEQAMLIAEDFTAFEEEIGRGLPDDGQELFS